MLKESAAKLIVKKAQQKTDHNAFEFNLVVFQREGLYQSKLIERHVDPISVASVTEILSVMPIEIHKLTATGQGRYKRIKCRDEHGDIYDSMLELVVIKEFRQYEAAGFISNITRQVPFSFKKIELNRTYSPDITFDCDKTFAVHLHKKSATFTQGQKYVCDVKSPLTKSDPTFALKKALMKVVFDITVVVVTRSYEKAKTTNRRKSCTPQNSSQLTKRKRPVKSKAKPSP